MKTRALLLALVAGIGGASACSDNRASLAVQAICFPTDTCAFKATCDAQVIGNVVMDKSLVYDAMLFLQVANQLPNNADADLKRLNTNDAHVNEVAVEYGGIGLPRDVYKISNMYVPAAGTSVIAVDAVRPLPANMAAIDATVPVGGVASLDARIRLRGYLDDGSSFETGEFPVAIAVCNGCLSPTPCGAGKTACPFVGMDPVGCGSTP